MSINIEQFAHKYNILCYTLLCLAWVIILSLFKKNTIVRNVNNIIKFIIGFLVLHAYSSLEILLLYTLY